MARLQRLALLLVLLLALPGPGAADLTTLGRFHERGGATEPSLPGLLGPMSPYQHQRLVLSQDLLTIFPEEGGARFSDAILVAERVTWGQAELLGYEGAPPIALRDLVLPSSGLAELAGRLGVRLSPGEYETMAQLDRVEEPMRSALARFIDAFLAFDEAGVGSRLFSSRVQFLEAVRELHGVAEPRTMGAAACEPVQVPLVFSIDLSDCDNTYVPPYALQLDLGGNDAYLNNAGGSNMFGTYSCNPLDPHGRAALVDLGPGNDGYGNPSQPRWCGVNGGGDLAGTGFLLDAGGDDTYAGGGVGVNGGGQTFGSGFLLDIGGADLYVSGSGGTNGGGKDGVGTLIDVAGDDVYVAGGGATNGGGSAVNGGGGRAFGILVDLGGDDVYSADYSATNGGGYNGGSGFLFDAAGSDSYTATFVATNGGGYFAGEGFLLDATGDDQYAAGEFGTNGGGCTAGRGLLVDLGGNDRYVAGGGGTNGGAGVCQVLGIPVPVAFGLLVDAGGADSYRDSLTDCSDCSVAPKGFAGAQLDG